MDFFRNLGFLRNVLRGGSGKKKGTHGAHPYAHGQPGYQDPAIAQNNSYGQYSGGESTDLVFIDGGIWLGSFQATSPQTLHNRGIANVLSCAVELMYQERERWTELENSNIAVMHVHWEDTPTQRICPSPEMDAALAWVDSIRAAGQQVLINCRMGISRSSSMVIAYLIQRMGHTYDSALELVRSKRPMVNPNPGFEQQLRQIRGTPGGGPADTPMADPTSTPWGAAPQVPAAPVMTQPCSPSHGNINNNNNATAPRSPSPAGATNNPNNSPVRGGENSPGGSPNSKMGMIRVVPSPGPSPHTYTLSMAGAQGQYFSPMAITMDPSASVNRAMLGMMDPSASVNRNLMMMSPTSGGMYGAPQQGQMMMVQMVPQYGQQW